MSEQLIQLSEALARTTERAAASLVAIHTEPRGSSSGVIWRDGIIVTAEHALRRDEEIQVTLPDGRAVPASLVGRDASTDLAVLKCEQASSPVNRSTDAPPAKPGSIALVIGRTRASGPVAALGVVSLVAAEPRFWTGSVLSPYIRLDVLLQPTAAGGVVVDAAGQVIGLATPRFARFGAIAIPAATVDRVVDTLLRKGRIPRGYLGVGLQPVRLPDALRESLRLKESTAVIVLEVDPQSPAQTAGMVIGDILIGLGGRPVTRPEDVHMQLTPDSIGKALPLQLLRGGAVVNATVTVAEREQGGN